MSASTPPVPTTATRKVKPVKADRLLLATATRPGEIWKSPEDFVFSLALQVPDKLCHFVQVFPFSSHHQQQRFLLCCASHSNKAAKPYIGKRHDIATTLLDRIEKSEWKIAHLLYVEGEGQLSEARLRMKDHLPFEGSNVNLQDVKDELAQREKDNKGKNKSTLSRGQQDRVKPKKRKRAEPTEETEPAWARALAAEPVDSDSDFNRLHRPTKRRRVHWEK
ncbi:hypothetical protein FRB90_007689 [Tulasnella sp. 427]|nr:hypothetical protein FRB90_007689 [Tulasnella sp. 427]